jgi:hypothetical protein
MTRQTQSIATAALVAFSLAAGACGLFEPRDPEGVPPPSGGGCRSLTGFTAVRLSIEDYYGRTANQTCYDALLDTAFAFHPDPLDSAQLLPQTPFLAWGDSVESRVNGNVASQRHFIEVDFIQERDPPVISPDQTVEVHFWEYQVRYANKAAPTDTVRFTGIGDLTVRRGSDGQWRLKEWVDHRFGLTDSTWGLFRQAFRF